jgi:GAF domain-containing protein/HAMP domain-containing protein
MKSSGSSPNFIRNLIYRIGSVSVTVKLIGTVLLVVIVSTAVQSLISFRNTQDMIQGQTKETMLGYYGAYNGRVDEAVNASGAIAQSFASRDDIKRLFLAGDRQGLIDLLTPIYSDLKVRYQFSHLYIEDAQGIVFVRIHDPGNFGDDVTYRRTTAIVIEQKKPAAGIEIGPNRMGVRGVAPMISNGELIGMVEVALDYDQEFLHALKADTNADFAMWLSYDAAAQPGLKPQVDALPSPTEELFFYTSTKTEMGKASPEAYRRVLQTSATQIEIVTENVLAPQIVLLAPIRKFEGGVIGVLEIVSPYAPTLQIIQQSQTTTGVIGLGVIFLAGALVWLFSFVAIVSPLRLLTQFADRETRGEVSARIAIKTGDEFGRLGTTFNSMAASIEQNRQELEGRVEQRTAQLRATNEVARVASSILDPDTLISQAVTLITKQFGYYYAAIFLTSSDGRMAILKDATGTAGQTLKARRHQLEVGGRSMVGTAISLRQARIALDVGAAPVRFNNPLLPDTRSEIALPMIVGDRALGALDVQSRQSAAFKEEDIETLQTMANQVAVALENARLFQETREALEEIRNVYSQYVVSSWTDKIRTSDLRYTTEIPGAAGMPELNILNVPMTLREQPLGSIKIESENEWTPDDRAWAEAVATQVAITLENARLIEESQQSALRERLAAAITEKVWAAQSVDNILQTAIRELGRALEASEATIELKVEE